MKFETHVFRSRDRQEAEGFALENKGGVGGVMDDDKFLLLCEFHNLLKEFRCGGSSSGIIGVVENENLSFVENFTRDRIQSWEKLIFWSEGKRVNDPSVVGGMGAEDWISGSSHQNYISWINEGGRQNR